MATVCNNHVADQKERSVCKVTCYVAASFPVVLGDFGFDVTCLAFLDSSNSVSSLLSSLG